jgi:hypothetical protein
MRLPADLVLAFRPTPGYAYTKSGILMARVSPDGVFEVLSAGAWTSALGYAPGELDGTSLRELMPPEKPAAGRILAALVDSNDAEPLYVTLRCKDRRRKVFRFHRRFDAYQDAMYIVADELPEGCSPTPPGPFSGANACRPRATAEAAGRTLS